MHTAFNTYFHSGRSSIFFLFHLYILCFPSLVCHIPMHLNVVPFVFIGFFFSEFLILKLTPKHLEKKSKYRTKGTETDFFLYLIFYQKISWKIFGIYVGVVVAFYIDSCKQHLICVLVFFFRVSFFLVCCLFEKLYDVSSWCVYTAYNTHVKSARTIKTK